MGAEGGCSWYRALLWVSCSEEPWCEPAFNSTGSGSVNSAAGRSGNFKCSRIFAVLQRSAVVSNKNNKKNQQQKQDRLKKKALPSPLLSHYEFVNTMWYFEMHQKCHSHQCVYVRCSSQTRHPQRPYFLFVTPTWHPVEKIALPPPSQMLNATMSPYQLWTVRTQSIFFPSLVMMDLAGTLNRKENQILEFANCADNSRRYEAAKDNILSPRQLPSLENFRARLPGEGRAQLPLPGFLTGSVKKLPIPWLYWALYQTQWIFLPHCSYSFPAARGECKALSPCSGGFLSHWQCCGWLVMARFKANQDLSTRS